MGIVGKRNSNNTRFPWTNHYSNRKGQLTSADLPVKTCLRCICYLLITGSAHNRWTILNSQSWSRRHALNSFYLWLNSSPSRWKIQQKGIGSHHSRRWRVSGLCGMRTFMSAGGSSWRTPGIFYDLDAYNMCTSCKHRIYIYTLYCLQNIWIAHQ